MTLAGHAGRLPHAGSLWVSPEAVPRLHVVVDTEEEFDWHAPYSRSSTGVTAMRHIERAQRIFDRYGIAPTYVVDYPVASQAEGFEPLCAIVARDGCTIGAHLHPWVTPPFDEPVSVRNSFTCNLAPALQRAKITNLRSVLLENLSVEPRVFKAGRYGLGPETVAILEAEGFDTDCSVCPRFDFSTEGGPSFTGNDSSIFMLSTSVIEVPCTVDYVGWAGALRPALHRLASAGALSRLRAVGVLSRLRAANRIMLSPEGNTLEEMKSLTSALLSRGQRLFTLSFHSPSIDPGHTPYVQSTADLDRFLRTIEQFCEFFLTALGGRPITSTAIRPWVQSFVESPA